MTEETKPSRLSDNDIQQKQKSAWKQFIASGSTTETTRPEINSAWQRCKNLRVDPYRTHAPICEDPSEWEFRLQKNKQLLDVSEPTLEYMHRFIKGSLFTVAISDSDGYLLTVRGDEETINQASGGNGQPRACWSEAAIGNNPIGTALTEKRPVMVVGFEHYCRCTHYWAGAGAPIYDPEGVLIGAISICGTDLRVHHHTIGMAIMAASAIEQQLRVQQALISKDILNLQKHAIINRVSEGVILLNKDNIIIEVNKAFSHTSGMKKEDAENMPITKLFNDTVFLEAIHNRHSLNDYITHMSTKHENLRCTVSFRPVPGQESGDGVLIINDIIRVKSLANMFGKDESQVTFDSLIGTSSKFLRTVEIGHQIAKSDASVLLLGESGTGKDMFAQSIHNMSRRCNGPYVAINCSALPKELIASELFGYEEGAFTGAKKGGNPGQFELADGGTLFLDEIGDMPLEVQAVMLRTLEQQTIRRVGGQKTRRIDTHIIAATNRDLKAEVAAGRFRSDLYYRLNIMSVTMVPLRERKEDIDLLIAYFLEEFNQKYNKSVVYVEEDARQLLRNYSWPGNIREMRNVMERAVSLAWGDSIGTNLLPDEVLNGGEAPPSPTTTSLDHAQSTLPIMPQHSEREMLLYQLQQNFWNITKTAKALGIARSTVYRKIDEYGLKLN